ncbi:MAG: hypothetical protein QOE82_2606, partial [Thermoanaerobaculia bacterium]|nr:hypothetical protein [Thermoanaerobaculia bacterium]
VSVQDIFPESLQSQRRAGSNLAGRALAALDRWIARRAAAIVVISERFAEHYRRRRGVEAARIHVVPNWMPAKPADESPDAAEACRQRHGISRDALLLVYGGNVGVSAAVETVIPVLEQVGDVHLLIAGEGASLDLCRRLAARVAPDRIHFESPWTDTMGVLHAADIVVLPTRANQSATSVPSKLISYFLSARPVIAVALDDSDTASAVRDAGAGVVVRPDDPGALAEAIRAMSQLTAAERSSMGRAGLAWAKANMTAEACLPRLAEIIEQVSR